MIYAVVFILLLIPVVKYDLLAKTGGEGKWFWSCLLLLVLLAGFRYRVGGDTLMYYGMFDECPTLDELKYFDFESAIFNPGWYIFNAICKSICDDFTFFQLVHALIVNTTFFHFFRKYCPKYYFSVMLVYYLGYFCYFNMEIMREALCISLLMMATDWLMEKKWIPYYLVCVFALFFHFSAAFMLCLPLLFLFKRNYWKWSIVIFIGVFAVVRIINVPQLLLGFIADDSSQLYLLVDKYIDRETNINGLLSTLLRYLPMLGILWLAERHDVRFTKDFGPLVLGTTIVFASMTCVSIFERFYNYFVPFVLIYFVETVYVILSTKALRQFQITYLSMLVVVGCFFFNIARFYLKDCSEFYPNTYFYVRYVPYHSIAMPKIEEQRERYTENERDLSINF